MKDLDPPSSIGQPRTRHRSIAMAAGFSGRDLAERIRLNLPRSSPDQAILAYARARPALPHVRRCRTSGAAARPDDPVVKPA